MSERSSIYGYADLDQNIIVIETLKRRKKSRRIVPVPKHFIMALDLTHGIRDAQTKPHMRDRLF